MYVISSRKPSQVCARAHELSGGGNKIDDGSLGRNVMTRTAGARTPQQMMITVMELVMLPTPEINKWA